MVSFSLGFIVNCHYFWQIFIPTLEIHTTLYLHTLVCIYLAFIKYSTTLTCIVYSVIL